MADFNDVVSNESTVSANAQAFSVDTAAQDIATYVYSDIDFKFDETTEFILTVDDAAVINSIWTMLNTSQAERVMEPEFGVKLNRFLFENITADLEELIMVTLSRGFERWDSRVEVTRARMISKRGGEGNEISVQVDIKIPGIANTVPVYITQPGRT